jgi:hypothetical protein
MRLDYIDFLALVLPHAHINVKLSNKWHKKSMLYVFQAYCRPLDDVIFTGFIEKVKFLEAIY